MLQAIEVGPTDPILMMLAQYHADPNPEKIDLGIGVYRDNKGRTPILKAVKEAEAILLKEEASKAYLGPAGDQRFNALITDLLLHDPLRNQPDMAQNLCTLQTPGGTGALRVAGDLIAHANPGATIWLSNPPWVTHRPIFSSAGLRLGYYRYFDPSTRGLDFEGMIDDLKDAAPGDVVLIQVAGHNPCGCDLNIEQWEQLSALLADLGVTPLLDLAYHGLCTGLESDLLGLRVIERSHAEWMLTYSASKTFGIYFERTGALLIKCKEKAICDDVRSEALNLICGNYYMPPGHGASVVRTILESEELGQMWRKELEKARHRISKCRKLLSDSLNGTTAWHYNFLNHQRGMFSYLGLNEAQLSALRENYSLYVGTGGRINVAGINEKNVERICEALKAVQR
ncbi:aromatic amino acid transaminase [Pontibacterium sp.]|uniref:amino acid aminotransferase n=1 Tax=Pontibacterium sp. TaxID=2036026 RepID=UPI003513F8C7